MADVCFVGKTSCHHCGCTCGALGRIPRGTALCVPGSCAHMQASSQRPALASHPGSLPCPAASTSSVTSLGLHAPGHGSLVTLAATSLVRSTLCLQQSWVNHSQRVWQDTKSHQLGWERMLSADAPVPVPKPHLISADLTPEEKHRVLSRSQFPRKYLFPLP